MVATQKRQSCEVFALCVQQRSPFHSPRPPLSPSFSLFNFIPKFPQVYHASFLTRGARLVSSSSLSRVSKLTRPTPEMCSSVDRWDSLGEFRENRLGRVLGRRDGDVCRLHVEYCWITASPRVRKGEQIKGYCIYTEASSDGSDTCGERVSSSIRIEQRFAILEFRPPRDRAIV